MKNKLLHFTGCLFKSEFIKAEYVNTADKDFLTCIHTSEN